MPEMKAMEFTDKLNLQPVTRPVPQPKAGEILIQVYATGGTPTEKLWYTTSHYADGSTRSKAIPGHEFAAIDCGRRSATSRPSTMPSPPSTDRATQGEDGHPRSSRSQKISRRALSRLTISSYVNGPTVFRVLRSN